MAGRSGGHSGQQTERVVPHDNSNKFFATAIPAAYCGHTSACAGSSGSCALRRLHLCCLHSPLARLSHLGISWRLWGLFRLFCAVCFFGGEFYGTVLDVREFFCTISWFIGYCHHLHHILFRCERMGILSFDCNKHVFL